MDGGSRWFIVLGAQLMTGAKGEAHTLHKITNKYNPT